MKGSITMPTRMWVGYKIYSTIISNLGRKLRTEMIKQNKDGRKLTLRKEVDYKGELGVAILQNEFI